MWDGGYFGLKKYGNTRGNGGKCGKKKGNSE